MKELPIEEKAKRYDEALEKSKRLYEQGTITESLAYIFPELKESEDESIRKEMISYFKQTNYDNAHTWNGINLNKFVAWLEKQYADPIKEYWRGYNEGKQYVLDKYAELEKQGKIVDYYEDRLDECACKYFNKGYKHALEKQGEYAENKKFLASEKRDFGYFNETTDKVEPKFHEGEWIISDTVNKDYHICKITGIKDGNYTIESIYGYKGYNQFDVFDNVYRLWTIQDAKDGDVLAREPIEGFHPPFVAIYKKQNEEDFGSYCFIGFDGKFYKGEDGHSTEEVHPATKEQRNTLMKAMANAGYTFDFEKKELNKIGSKPIEWSEEDEYYRNIILYILNNECVGKTDKENAINWLKSLKSHNEC